MKMRSPGGQPWDYGQVQECQHRLCFNANNWPAGSYILQVRTARGQHTQQLLKVN